MSRLLVLQHLDREGPGFFSRIASKRGMNIHISRLDLGEPLPEPIKGDLLLVLGGPMGVRDIGSPSFPWLSEEISLIKKTLEKGISIIGVCLGAQLLAKAAGGDVEPLLDHQGSSLCPEVGWGPILFKERIKDKYLKSYFESPLNVLHWHGDRILLPSNAQLIASSKRCKEQLFSIGEFAYGLQFHVEIEDKMVYRWINEDVAFIESALGKKAKEILFKQQEINGGSTLNVRLKLMNNLFETLGF